MVYASPGSELTRAGKYKLGARAGKYELGDRARGQGQCRGISRGPGAKIYTDPFSTENLSIHVKILIDSKYLLDQEY